MKIDTPQIAAPKISASVKAWLIQHRGSAANGDESYFRKELGSAVALGALSIDDVSSMTKSDEAVAQHELKRKALNMRTTSPNPADVFAGVRVKEAGEGYGTTKVIGKHLRTGQAVAGWDGTAAMLPSELELAKSGAMFKQLAARSGIEVNLTDHDRQLWGKMIEEDVWCGKVGSEWYDEISPLKVKSVLSDTLSGGLYVNPYWFDAALVTFPLLSGELLPMVTLRDMPRSNRVEGASISNPSVSWGIGEGTEMNLFDTDALCAEISTSVYPVSVCVEVGRDLLSDSPVDVGRYITEAVGRSFAHELDNVIANGSGTDRPEGLFQSSGVATVNSTNGTGGPPSVADGESLVFGIEKQYRAIPSQCCFVGNDVTYKRMREIQNDPNSPTTDQRLIHGMDIQSYSCFGVPYKVQQDIGNSTVGYGNLSFYRLFRRLGFSFEWVTTGAELARRNLALLVARGRFGGRLMNHNAFVKMTDAQS